jgi:hypothetical protein
VGDMRRAILAALFVASLVGLVWALAPASATTNASRHARAIRVNEPRLTIAGTWGTVRGRVPRNLGIAQVTLERQRPPHKKWTVIARVGVHSGRFTFRIRAPRMTGALRLRVIGGPSSHPIAKSRVFALPVTQTQVLKPSSVLSAPAPGQTGKLIYRGRSKPKSGGFVAVGMGKATPDGLLVKVIAVSGSSRHWILTAKPASLFDAIPVGQIHLNPRTAGEAAAHAHSDHALRPRFDLKCSAGATAQADGSASLSLKPSLDMNWGWDWVPPHPVLNSASFTITATGSVQASASLQGSGSCSFEQELFKHDFSPFDIQIGPVPVVIVPELLTTLKADADASASISTSVQASMSATGGLKYNGSKASPVSGFTKSFSFQPPTPQAKGSIGARLVPAGRLLVYGIAGPEVDLSGGPQFDVDTSSSSLWRLHVPVDLSAQLVVPDTPLHLGPLDVYNHDFTLAQGSTTGGGGASVTVANPGDQTGLAGTTARLQIQATDTDGGSLSYSAAGLPPGLSIDARTGLISGTPTTLGTSSVTVTARDATGPSRSATFNWTMVSTQPSGSCEASSSVFVTTRGTNVVAYVPKGNWLSTTTGVSLVNVEGSSVTPTLISTANVVNSAASDAVTGEAVAIANNTDVYLLNGASLTNTLTSGGSGTISFTGGSPTDAGVAMDSAHNRAAIALSVGGTPGFQFLDLNSNTFGSPVPSPGGAVSEDPLIDPFRNLLLSASENGNFEIADVSNAAHPVFYENATGGGELNSTGEDCATGIAVAPAEFSDPSTVYIADLTQATLTPGSSAGTWSAPSQTQTLSESSLASGASAVAVAQGTHTGVLAGEFGGNQITAFKLPTTSGSGTPAITDWVTCGIDNTPDSNAWSEGNDPHTMTAYQTPNGGDAIGLFGNDTASWLARVDLTQLLNPAIVPRDTAGHACASGTIPSSMESFIAVP